MAKISLSYPDTGLTISISVRNRVTGVEDFSGTMTEVGTTREYKYDFTETADTDYVYVATVSGYTNISGAIYRDGGGLTAEEHTKLFSLENSNGGGGFSINYGAINGHTTKKLNELDEKVMKELELLKGNDKEIYKKVNETNSHIDIAKEEIIDTIKESENEVCSDIVRSKKEIKEDNVSTRNLVRQKTKKLDENVSKLSDRQDLTDKAIEEQAEEIEEELERIYEQEADMLENEINSQFEKEAQDIETELNS